MKKILVTGSNGQLGSELQSLAAAYSNFEFVFTDRSKLSLEKPETISAYLTAVRPDYIINCAAYTAVDKAESEPELADLINHQAVEALAQWSFLHRAKLIHISTDYVFDGTSALPLKEDDATNPQNEYGRTKLRGEQAALKENPESIIIRTSWVYSEFGNNFVKTMLRLMKERDTLNVVEDQIGSPTYAKDLAQAVLAIISQDQWQGGIYHYSNEGAISWHEFALAIKEMAALDCEISGIPSSQFPTPAKRPAYSLLDTSKIKATYGLSVANYRRSLALCLNNILS
ncbi:dTDP-4-dehydrorhamnose reductase [Flavobacterium macacae]|uniref:dTDP-4-dehydrorhamnose reductase n=1 Tax=Flavobacterium macacae TaxID=2488993 RepID=A0A3P3VY71_9FLAO|nr:dTDP-4-dehydrorhamnose reductase [Flavobacterium macacae]RRJ87751.1 dTDP-4-dehydrorhamnose reductase [Flavobacterium macacae]